MKNIEAPKHDFMQHSCPGIVLEAAWPMDKKHSNKKLSK